MIKDLFPWLKEQLNLTLEVKEVIEHNTGNLTLYIYYSGPLQALLTSRFLKVDISRDEALVFPVNIQPVLSPYSDCRGFYAILNAYSIEEILAEKLRSLLSRVEPRDLFDVYYMLINKMADIELVSDNISPKFDAKNQTLSDLRTILARKKSVFKRLWQFRLEGQMPDIPELEEAIRETNRFLIKYF